MKSLLIALMMVFTTVSQAENCMHLGKYVSQGTWIQVQPESTTRTPYTVHGSILNNRYQATYKWEEGGQAELDFTVRCTGDGFFELVGSSDSVVMGQGYCIDSSCHYASVIPNGRVEETITFSGTEVTKVGSKIQDGEKIAWKEIGEIVE